MKHERDLCNTPELVADNLVVSCDLLRGHGGIHRAPLGAGTFKWLCDTPKDPRQVRVELPAVGAYGRVHIGHREVSNVVYGVDVRANVHEITEITLHLKPGSVDVNAHGVGVIDPETRNLLIALGWQPPETVASEVRS